MAGVQLGVHSPSTGKRSCPLVCTSSSPLFITNSAIAWPGAKRWKIAQGVGEDLNQHLDARLGLCTPLCMGYLGPGEQRVSAWPTQLTYWFPPSES